jgi:anti-anti-sigma factor
MADPGAFSVDVSDDGPGRAIVAVSGELDLSKAPELLDAIAALGDAGTNAVVIDLSELTFIDSSGISALIKAGRETRARGGSVVVAAPTVNVRRVFEIVRLADVLSLEPSVEAAAQRLDRNGPT